MDGIRASQRVQPGQVTGLPLHRCGEFNRAYRSPVALPLPFGDVNVVIIEVVITSRGGQRSSYFWVGEPT